MVKYSFLCPGQGSQSVGMATELFNEFSCVRERFALADEITQRPLSGIIQTGPMEVLTATENTQPALFTVEASIIDVLSKQNIRPTVAAGHSLGEFSALYAAGVFSFEDGLRAVTHRGKLMAEAGLVSPGTMAAVIGMDKEVLADTLLRVDSGIVVTANENTPEQTVISGDVAAIEDACERCKTAGARRAIRLPVSGAFHSPLMQGAADEFAEFLATVEFAVPSCPVISNVSAKPENDPVRIKELLLKQLISPVRWVETMLELAGMDHGICLETGPGAVLKGLARNCDKSLNVISCGTATNIYSLLNN